MSSDGFFEDDIDQSFLNELDAIEASNYQPTNPQPPPKAPPLTRHDTSDYFDETFDVDDTELQRLDNFIEDAYQGKAAPVAGPSNLGRTNSKGMVQTTLFGGVLPERTSSSKTKGAPSSSRTLQRVTSKKKAFGQQAPKTKVWDRTAFAKTGWKKGPKGDKGKGKAVDDGERDDWDEEEPEEFEQFPAPFVPIGPPPPMRLEPDLLEARHWFYPLNQPKRDYQFNIVKHSLFENTLVALPTGLGKTFISGVVMLNFYRWFPEGKVIFVAPTKPLVAQQVEACHRTCGIPGSDAAEMTGEIPKAKRARLWEAKRVFFMTPQTLVNDLATGICDPLNVILIVVDEAHKATGDYAYSQVIRFMMAKNPHFRVLALSATPGSDPERVQNIIDHLHISRIEIRDENSMDLREYMFTKEIKQHVIAMNDDINKVKDLLAKLMKDTSKKLEASGIFEMGLNVIRMHPFRTQLKMQEVVASKRNMWALTPISMLGKLARAMGYLFEASLKMCYTSLKEAVEEKGDGAGTKSNQKSAAQLRSNPGFQALMTEIEGQNNRTGGPGPHPKMEQLKTLLVQHFGSRMSDEQDGEEQETRAMVFVTNRGCVDEIVEMLNNDRPLLRATKFIGQGTDKQGKKGFAQKEQLQVIQKFKDGEYNVLVSTSIGEEGLDIGEIDMIICYDAQKTPIRMLQRIGRTGRKRTGYVHVLLSEIREEANWDKAKDTHGEVQKQIVRGELLELYGDVERLLPDHVKPECVERKMDIEEYVREEKEKKVAGSSATAAKKRKRDENDMGRNIPPGTVSGFVKASELKKRKKTKPKEFDPLAGEDDDTDLEIEAGIHGPPRRTASTPASSKPTKKKKTLRKAATTVDGTAEPSKRKQKKSSKSQKDDVPSASQFSQKGVDDSDDLELEQGIAFITQADTSLQLSHSPRRESSAKYSISPDPLDLSAEMEADGEIILSPNSTALARVNTSPSRRRTRFLARSPSPDPLADAIIDISSSPDRSPSNSPAPNHNSSLTSGSGLAKRRVPPAHSPAVSRSPDENLAEQDDSMAWLLEGDDDDTGDIEIVDSSPILARKQVTQPSDGGAGGPSRTRTRIQNTSQKGPIQPDDSVEIVDSSVLPSANAKSSPATPTSPLAPLQLNSSSAQQISKSHQNHNMPPPLLPSRFTLPSPEQEDPEPSFAVRPVGKRQKKRLITTNDSASPLLETPSPLQRRLQRKRSESPPVAAPKPRHKSDRKGPKMPNPWVDHEAVHSGDEVSEGSSQVDEVETEYDREFLRSLPETQASPSYDQSLAYRQSLFTQAPAMGRAPMFANRPAARGARFLGGLNTRPRPIVSSSPPPDDSEPNEYVMGSFVVDDDAEMTFASSES